MFVAPTRPYQSFKGVIHLCHRTQKHENRGDGSERTKDARTKLEFSTMRLHYLGELQDASVTMLKKEPISPPGR